MEMFNKIYFNDIQVSNSSQNRTFSPYSMNGGSVVAIAGDDYAVIGADTRLSQEFSIFTRGHKKLLKLTDSSVMGVTGCWGDALTLSRLVHSRIQMYKHEHNKVMSTPALAQMLATLLYYKRFFPYYVLNILAGLDEKGKGCIFSYDPVGHCERSAYCAVGTAGPLVQPLLDNQIGLKNMKGVSAGSCPKEKAMSVIKDAFISATERDIYTGVFCREKLFVSAIKNRKPDPSIQIHKKHHIVSTLSQTDDDADSTSSARDAEFVTC